MSSSGGGGAAACDRMYSKLIEDGGACVEVDRCPDVRGPVSALRLLTGGPWSYRLATVCLAALCTILLIVIIAVTANYKSKPQVGGEASSAAQKQDAEGSALTASIKKLQQEKDQLQKENDDLRSQLAAATATKAPPKAIVCPNRWLLFSSSCYFISTNQLSWNEAQAHCVTQGAHLAIIHTAEEQTFLWNQLPRGHWMATWFGITDAETEDQWKWVDGTPLDGGFWEDGEPNNHINEDCGYIVKTLVLSRVAVHSWYDAPCHMSLPFICEKEMG